VRRAAAAGEVANGTTWARFPALALAQLLAEPAIADPLDATYRDLLTLLHEISFLGLVRRRDDRAVFLHETSTTVVSEDILNPHAYEIHLAFWRALQINEDYKD